MRYLCILIIVAAVLPACDALQSDDYQENVVVESYQVALKPLQPVRVTRTAPFSSVYDTTALAVEDAEVAVELLAEDGSVVETYPYVLRAEPWAGVYEAQADARVLPLRTYRLRVEVPGEELITAQTLVPDTFRVVEAGLDTVVYQGSRQLEVRVSRSGYPGRQNVFVFTTEARGPLSVDRLTPFLRSFIEEEDDVDLEDLRLGSSPLINEANYTVNDDETVTIPLPWIAVSWYEELEVGINAIDENMLDFLRSNEVQQGGGATLAPGEIPALLTHVENGTGLFGSYARITERIYVERP